MLLHGLIFIVGLLFLYYGAEWLVKSSSRIARYFGIRPLIIGLTIVAFGTSAPEAFVSIMAVIKQTKDIALGNIIGSNIANIGLILGLSALVSPLRIERPILRIELPVMVGASVVLYLMALKGRIGFIDGLALLFGLILFLWSCFISARGKPVTSEQRYVYVPGADEDGMSPWKNTIMAIIGLVGLAGGSYCVVTSSVFVARAFGVSELVIGISLVAVGTSLPEMATSMVASYRNETEICVGNIVGSNIFNTLFVLGTVSIIAPLEIEAKVLTVHFPIMLIFSFALFPLMKSGFTLSRKEGGVLLGGFVLFLILLF